MSARPDGRSRYRFKGVWDAEGYEGADEASGSLCLVAHNSAVAIHDIRVEPLGNSSG